VPEIPPDCAVLSENLRGLLPSGVVVAELRGEGDPGQLMALEASFLGRAVPRRARQFAAGRQCARRALAEFGILGFPLQVAPDRRALWPPSVVGNITHTDGFCAAAVAERKHFAALGIDTEAARAVHPELWDKIARPAEIAWIKRLAEGEQAAAATLIFSAKEAFYKCQYPLTTQSLDFADAMVQILSWGGARGAFTVSASRAIAIADLAPMPLRGEYLFHDEFVTTAVCLSNAMLRDSQ